MPQPQSNPSLDALRTAANLASFVSPLLSPIGDPNLGEYTLGDENDDNPLRAYFAGALEGAQQARGVIGDSIFLGFLHPNRDLFHTYRDDAPGIAASKIAMQIGIGAATFAWGGPEMEAVAAARNAPGFLGLVKALPTVKLAALIGEGGNAVRAAQAAEAAEASTLGIWAAGAKPLLGDLAGSALGNLVVDRLMRSWIERDHSPMSPHDIATDLAQGMQFGGIVGAMGEALDSFAMKGLRASGKLYAYITKGTKYRLNDPENFVSWFSKHGELEKDWIKHFLIGGSQKMVWPGLGPLLSGTAKFIVDKDLDKSTGLALSKIGTVRSLFSDRNPFNWIKGMKGNFRHINPLTAPLHLWDELGEIPEVFIKRMWNEPKSRPGYRLLQRAWALEGWGAELSSTFWGQGIIEPAIKGWHAWRDPDSEDGGVKTAAQAHSMRLADRLISPFPEFAAPGAPLRGILPAAAVVSAAHRISPAVNSAIRYLFPELQMARNAITSLGPVTPAMVPRITRNIVMPSHALPTPIAAMRRLVPHLPDINDTVDILAAPLTELAVHTLPVYRALTQGAAENRHEQVQSDYLTGLVAFQRQQRERRADAHGAGEDSATQINDLNTRIAQETKAYQDAGAAGDFEGATLHLNNRGELVRKRNGLVQASRQPPVLPENPGAAVLAVHRIAAQSLTRRENQHSARLPRSGRQPAPLLAAAMHVAGMGIEPLLAPGGVHPFNRRSEVAADPVLNPHSAPNGRPFGAVPHLDVRLRNTQTRLPSGRIQINFHADPVVIDDTVFSALAAYGH